MLKDKAKDPPYGPLISPGAGRIIFSPAETINFVKYYQGAPDYKDQNGMPRNYYTPVWDSDQTAFGTAVDSNQMYSNNSAYTLDGEGYLHLYLRSDCTCPCSDCSMVCPVPCLSFAGGSQTYTLTGDRGPEYNTDSAALTVYSDGHYSVSGVDGATVILTLGHVVDSRGYMSGDYHVHAMENEEMDKKARSLLDLTRGLNLTAHSPHFGYHYYEELLDGPACYDSGIPAEQKPWCRKIFFMSSIEEEVFGISMGYQKVSGQNKLQYNSPHFGYYPQYSFHLYPDQYRDYPQSGDPTCNPYCKKTDAGCNEYCPDYPSLALGALYANIDNPDFRLWSRLVGNRETEYFFHRPEAIRWKEMYAERTFFHLFYRVIQQRASFPGHPLFLQVNHPCAGGGGYFLMLDQEGKVRETIPMPQPDGSLVDQPTDLYLSVWRDDFNGTDINHGRGYQCTLCYDPWYKLLNQGYRITRLYNTDGHLLTDVLENYTYARSPISSLADLHGDTTRQFLADAITQALFDGQAFYTKGPFLRVSADYQNASGPHTAQDAVGQTITLEQAHNEVIFHVNIQTRNEDPAERGVTSLTAIVNGDTYNFSGNPGMSVNMLAKGTTVGQRREATLDVPVRVDRDSWVSFITDPKIAQTNPVWIDLDGDGRIRPLHQRPAVNIMEVWPTTVHPGDTIYFTVKVDPAPAALPKAWIASNYWEDPRTVAACRVADPHRATYLCSRRALGDWPEYPGPENEVRVTAKAPNGFRSFAYSTVEIIFFDDYVITFAPGSEQHTSSGSQYNDQDSDGLPDWWEKKYFGDAVSAAPGADDDNDGLNNLAEYNRRTNPKNPDTDGDGISDGLEVSSGCLNPLSRDTDGDGSPDGEEDSNHNGVVDPGETSPCDPDTDHDVMWDGFEKTHPCLNPLAGDSQLDYDNDGLPAMEEYNLDTDPCSSDTDQDGLPDDDEIFTFNTNPQDKDTDADGLTDDVEITIGTDPHDPDTDHDGLRDNVEYFAYHTDPALADTDNDRMDDAYEVNHTCLNPLLGDSLADPDGDSLSNLQEYTIGTNPCNPDTDGDGLGDGGEVLNFFTDPLKRDTDGDGLDDGQEINVYHTDPLNVDSDHDGLSDGLEVQAGLSPLYWDTDHDALPDKFEYSTVQFNPLNPADGPADLDGDKIGNADEYWNRSRIAIPDPVGFGAPGDSRSFWADSGAGDGVVGPEDISVMRALVAGDFSNMATLKFYNVLPTSGQTMDLDPDGVFAATDLSALRDMLAGRNCNYVGSMPSALDLSNPPASTVQVGSTTHVGVKVKAQRTGKYMTGAAVVFTIDTVLSKGRASLFGGDGPSMDHPDYGKYRWDQAGQLNSSATDETPSRIMIRVDAAGTIIINVYTPEVGISGQGRYMPYLELAPVSIKGEE